VTRSDRFSIAEHEVGTDAPCFVVAEVAQAHDGSLGNAHAYIDAAADAGASAVKFQTHIAAEESTPAEPWRVRFSRQDASRYEYWKRMEFSAAAWRELADHARERGLVFLSSPFSVAAVELLEGIGMPAWKVASGEITNHVMIKEIAATGMPVLLSSGLATRAELDDAFEIATSGGSPAAVFQTTTSYPCPAEQVGLNVLAELRQRYCCPVGLSDHSATVFAGLAAVSLGADLLEAHIVFSRRCFGPDTTSSLDPVEFEQLVRGVKFIERALGHPVDKEATASELDELRTTFGRSLVARRDLSPGSTLQPDDLIPKKPGTGIPATRLAELVGRTLKRTVPADALLQEEDLD